ncbi:UNVERIFIED_CONTAM: hypothetical protein K2H54_058446 [Gekko kuhli]
MQISPKLLCPKDRVLDIDAIYSVIDDAQQFVYVATMEYLPIVRDHNETRNDVTAHAAQATRASPPPKVLLLAKHGLATVAKCKVVRLVNHLERAFSGVAVRLWNSIL